MRIIEMCVVSIGVLITAGSLPAFAIGDFEMESHGFLRSSSTRSNSSNSLYAGPRLEFSPGWVEGKIQGGIYTFLSDPNSWTPEFPELYLKTGSKLSEKHQLTLGRRLFPWSEADDQWKFGIWQPRFNWDPLAPASVGLSGATYSFDTSRVHILAFITPVSIPDRGYPIQQSDEGRLTSPSPAFIAPPEKVAVMNRSIPIRYQVQSPPIGEILFRPAAAVQVGYGEKKGLFAKGGYGYLPVHAPDLTVSAGYLPQAGYVQAKILPRFLQRHVGQGEVGYRGDFFKTWISSTREIPIKQSYEPGYSGRPVGQAWIYSALAELTWQEQVTVYGTGIVVKEDMPAWEPGPVKVDLGSRFAYERAWKAGATWKSSQGRVQFGVSWINDIDTTAGLASTDLTFRFWENLEVGGGTDLITAPTRKGFLGKFSGEDRVRGRIAYAF